MTAPAAERAPRALALDALRGLAILAMCLSGRVPFGENALPAWMYHAQNPPPSGALNTAVAGFTWVDLVFPLFLFSMGVAFPFAMASRLAKGASVARLIGASFLRGLALAAFAIYFQHVTPGVFLAQGEGARWGIALLGLALLFPVYLRLPDAWPAAARVMIRTGGIAAAAILVLSLDYAGKGGPLPFSVTRSNIILLVLANMAFFGTALWLLTRDSVLLRLGVMGLVYAGLQAYKVEGSWVRFLVEPNLAPVLPQGLLVTLKETVGVTDLRWLYRFEFLKYLLIVLPGTVVGEELLRWMKAPKPAETGWSPAHLAVLALVPSLVVLVVHAGLQGRFVGATAAFSVATLGACALLVQNPRTPAEVLLRNLLAWGGFWLLLGFFFEPAEGGIKKSPSNMSYYFTSLGLSILLLLALTIVMDVLGRRRPFGLLVGNGQNPMLAYLGINNLMEPLVALTGAGALAAATFTTPWGLGFWAMVKTLLLAVMIWGATRCRLVWRT